MQNQFFLAVVGIGTFSKDTTSTRIFLFDNTNYNFRGFPSANLEPKNPNFEPCKSHQVTLCGEPAARNVMDLSDAPRP